ncbi:MAG: 50S ribosomal protein L11 methyltransferase [Lacibacter sp.]
MNNYIKASIDSSVDEEREILIALLSNEGYDGFEETPSGLNAYISEEIFDEALLKEILQPFEKAVQTEVIAPKNWNAEWESNYEPVIVEDFVAVRAHFHQPITNVKHEIIITPKMSFGTGHHATTWQVMKLMQEIDFTNKTVFDFGCGTGVLAILAEMLGASSVLAIDNDDWCIENSLENVANNHCAKTEVKKGEEPPVNRQFEIILANINRHILLQNMDVMAKTLGKNGYLLVSGFYANENSILTDAATVQGLQLIKASDRHNWSAMLFQKMN